MQSGAKPTASQINSVREYLETHFPSKVGSDRWDGARYAQIFEVYPENVSVYVIVAYEFFRDMQNHLTQLKSANLAKAIRETGAKRTRISVRKDIQVEPS